MTEISMETYLHLNDMDESQLELVLVDVQRRLGIDPAAGIDIESMTAEQIEEIRDRCSRRAAELRKES